MDKEIVAVALVTAGELARLGADFDRAFPLAESDDFEELLLAIDKADRALRGRMVAATGVPLTRR